MKIVIPRELHPGERRVAVIPSGVKSLVDAGARVEIESGLGKGAGYSDEDYIVTGAGMSEDRAQLLSGADMVLRLRKPPEEELELLKPGCIHVSFLSPFSDAALIERLAAREVSALSMDMVPRSTRAQKMDALSSQANLAGYMAVILAATLQNKIFPMMITPAGSLAPCRVFVIGAGVAGLQAIATAKRLGARVEAYDTRPGIEEQIRSVGARFLRIDIGETGQTEQGYAKPLTEEQLAKQREAMAQTCAASDVVITTAQVFGRKAPLIVTNEMVDRMQRGSVVIDLAVETGGNVEASVYDQTIERNGVKVAAPANLPGEVPVHASQMYSSNIVSLVLEFWDKERKEFLLKMEDEIIKSCLITHQGRLLSDHVTVKG
jgi:H+-translocating NAD(P) transhydrogenase subunit alpha